MKILVIGGMHGNEPLGIELVESLRANPIKNVDALLANPEAIRQNVRFTRSDLNRSFPGNLKSLDYEMRRAAEILSLTRGYDVVLDFHNTNCPDNDCSFVGEDARQRLFDVSAWLGLRRVVVADYECINKYASNCLSVEISLDSLECGVQAWRKKIAALSKLDTVPKMTVSKYLFVYRMTLRDRDQLGLMSKDLKAFEPLDSKLAAAMGVKSPAYPIFINDAYTPYNYGGLLNKIR